MLKGLPQLEIRGNTVSAGCQYGKGKAHARTRSLKPLKLIHSDVSDVFGRVKQPSISGMRYMVTNFKITFNSNSWVYLLKEQSETLANSKMERVQKKCGLEKESAS